MKCLNYCKKKRRDFLSWASGIWQHSRATISQEVQWHNIRPGKKKQKKQEDDVKIPETPQLGLQVGKKKVITLLRKKWAKLCICQQKKVIHCSLTPLSVCSCIWCTSCFKQLEWLVREMRRKHAFLGLNCLRWDFPGRKKKEGRRGTLSAEDKADRMWAFHGWLCSITRMNRVKNQIRWSRIVHRLLNSSVVKHKHNLGYITNLRSEVHLS